MGFANLIGLLGLLFVPVIVILYMLRPKNKPYEIPSLYLWKYAIDEIESASRLKKLKSSILMLLQILAVVLISLILAGLFINDTAKSSKVIVVIDSSVTMQSEDILPNRLAYAKELAVDYVEQLNANTKITVVSLKEVPEILMTNETDQKMVQNMINQLEATDAITDMSLVEDTLDSIREEGSIVVYFGDRILKNATNYQTIKSDYNMSVYDVSYTKYPSSNSITALVEVYNHSNKTEMIPLSIYVDGVFFSAKQIELETKQSGKIFFEDIPYEINEIKAVLDVEDIMTIDNVAYTVIHDDHKKKVVLVTESNVFLEKVLKINSSIEVYKAEPKDVDILKGYDLYIFDGVFKEELPTDGAVLLFDPGNYAILNQLGYVERPVFTTTNHPIVNHIGKPEFSTFVTSVYNVGNTNDIIYNTEFGAAAFTTELSGSRVAVFGFDIHNTDLPLSIEFPIIMTNLLEYLLPSTLLEASTVYAGESLSVRINPNITKAYITNPEGINDQLDISRSVAIYTNTNKTGVYSLVQESKDSKYTEKFVVNVPKQKASDRESNQGDDAAIVVASTKSLALIIGIGLVIIMLVEWFIYSYRRRMHGPKL